MNRLSSRWRLAVAAIATVVAVVGLSAPAAAAAAVPTGGTHVAPATVGVQTYNMYFGADLQKLFTNPDPVAAATAIWAEMQASNIPDRAMAVARQIAARQPDLVGLQEVSTWRSAPAVATGPTTIVPTGPFVTDYDALALLLADLASLGTRYTFVTANTNFSNDVDVPTATAPPLPIMTASGLRLASFTDRDVILVRTSALCRGRIRVLATENHTFTTQLVVAVAGQPVSVPRGWSAVDVRVQGRMLRFANTHFEAYTADPVTYPLKDNIRNAQALELANALKTSPFPVVLVGDINARPTLCKNVRLGQPQWAEDQNYVAYATLQKAWLREVWPLVHPRNPCGAAGWTSGQSALDNAASTLDHRIDDVFLSRGLVALRAVVVGDEAADRTPGGLWPSDHASTWAVIGIVTW